MRVLPEENDKNVAAQVLIDLEEEDVAQIIPVMFSSGLVESHLTTPPVDLRELSCVTRRSSGMLRVKQHGSKPPHQSSEQVFLLSPLYLRFVTGTYLSTP